MPISSDESTFKILVTTDNHLGFCERDARRGDDSFTTFEEILRAASVEHDVDFILLGGDLFHENKPSLGCLSRTSSLLRKYIMGNKAINFSLLSDPSKNFPTHAIPLANFQDPNINIAYPIFAIHGNHDDPVGGTSALDILATNGLINYFGHVTSLEEIVLEPILLRKDDSYVALYGLGNVRDERLHRCFRSNKVRFLHPKPIAGRQWFNILLVHQNRGIRSSTNKCGILESMLSGFGIDLVIWGNEHEQLIVPQPSSGYDIIQPGSTVMTSLSTQECNPKQYGILEIRQGSYRLTPFPLQSLRPVVRRTVELVKENPQGRTVDAVEEFLHSIVSEMIEDAEDQISKIPDDVLNFHPNIKYPLMRLVVDFSDPESTPFPQPNANRFGQKYLEVVANPEEMLKPAIPKKQRNMSGVNARGNGIAGGEEDKRMQFSSHLLDSADIRAKVAEVFNSDARDPCQLLSEHEVSAAVYAFVEKGERDAIGERIRELLNIAQKSVWRQMSCGASDTVLKADCVLEEVEKHKQKLNKLYQEHTMDLEQRGKEPPHDQEMMDSMSGAKRSRDPDALNSGARSFQRVEMNLVNPNISCDQHITTLAQPVSQALESERRDTSGGKTLPSAEVISVDDDHYKPTSSAFPKATVSHDKGEVDLDDLPGDGLDLLNKIDEKGRYRDEEASGIMRDDINYHNTIISPSWNELSNSREAIPPHDSIQGYHFMGDAGMEESSRSGPPRSSCRKPRAKANPATTTTTSTRKPRTQKNSQQQKDTFHIPMLPLTRDVIPFESQRKHPKNSTSEGADSTHFPGLDEKRIQRLRQSGITFNHPRGRDTLSVEFERRIRLVPFVGADSLYSSPSLSEYDKQGGSVTEEERDKERSSFATADSNRSNNGAARGSNIHIAVALPLCLSEVEKPISFPALHPTLYECLWDSSTHILSTTTCNGNNREEENVIAGEIKKISTWEGNKKSISSDLLVEKDDMLYLSKEHRRFLLKNGDTTRFHTILRRKSSRAIEKNTPNSHSDKPIPIEHFHVIPFIDPDITDGHFRREEAQVEMITGFRNILYEASELPKDSFTTVLRIPALSCYTHSERFSREIGKLNQQAIIKGFHRLGNEAKETIIVNKNFIIELFVPLPLLNQFSNAFEEEAWEIPTSTLNPGRMSLYPGLAPPRTLLQYDGWVGKRPELIEAVETGGKSLLKGPHYALDGSVIEEKEVMTTIRVYSDREGQKKMLDEERRTASQQLGSSLVEDSVPALKSGLQGI